MLTMDAESAGTDDQRRDTLVTAIYRLDPFGPLGGRGRRVESYFPSLASVAALDAGLVVFTHPDSVDQVASTLRQFNIPSKVIGRELATVPRYAQIQEVRTRQQVHLRPFRGVSDRSATPLPPGPDAWKPMLGASPRGSPVRSTPGSTEMPRLTSPSMAAFLTALSRSIPSPFIVPSAPA